LLRNEVVRRVDTDLSHRIGGSLSVANGTQDDAVLRSVHRPDGNTPATIINKA
jgi:hypothetical protein